MDIKNIRYDSILWIVILAISVVFMVVSFQYPLMNNSNVPGPGFLPLIISIISIICTSVELIKSIKNKSTESEFNFKDDNLLAIVRIVGAILVYIILSKLLGFIIPFAIMVFILFIGNCKLSTSLIMAAVVTIAMYLLFIKLLALPLPLNAIGF